MHVVVQRMSLIMTLNSGHPPEDLPTTSRFTTNDHKQQDFFHMSFLKRSPETLYSYTDHISQKVVLICLLKTFRPNIDVRHFKKWRLSRFRMPIVVTTYDIPIHGEKVVKTWGEPFGAWVIGALIMRAVACSGWISTRTHEWRLGICLHHYPPSP